MGKIKWYKRDPRAALTGMMGLNLEERGAYNTVLDLIYDRDGDLPDDERFIAGWMRCDVRVWRRLRDRLIELGKLYVADGKIRNSRSDEGVLEALSRITSSANAGRTSAHKRKAKSSENNDMASTAVATAVSTNIETESELRDSVSIETGRTASPPPSAKQALWAEMKAHVGGKNPGALIGKWVKQYTLAVVVECHFRAMADPPADYVTWMVKSLEAYSRGHGPPGSGGNGATSKYQQADAIVEEFIESVTGYESASDRTPQASGPQPPTSHLRLAYPTSCEYAPRQESLGGGFGAAEVGLHRRAQGF